MAGDSRHRRFPDVLCRPNFFFDFFLDEIIIPVCENNEATTIRRSTLAAAQGSVVVALCEVGPPGPPIQCNTL